MMSHRENRFENARKSFPWKRGEAFGKAMGYQRWVIRGGFMSWKCGQIYGQDIGLRSELECNAVAC